MRLGSVGRRDKEGKREGRKGMCVCSCVVVVVDGLIVGLRWFLVFSRVDLLLLFMSITHTLTHTLGWVVWSKGVPLCVFLNKGEERRWLGKDELFNGRRQERNKR